MTFYFKATTSDGRVVTRSTNTKPYTRAFVPDSGSRANWATGGHTPAEARKYPGQLVSAVEIDAREYRELNKPANPIVLVYEAVDGSRTKRTFKSLVGARQFAWDRVGRHATIGSHYAVSDDGVGKITIESGVTLDRLFPEPR